MCCNERYYTTTSGDQTGSQTGAAGYGRRMPQLATVEVNAVTKVAGQELKAFNTAIDNAVKRLYPYAPREGQRYALRKLLDHQSDLILIAKTSFGTSMILQVASVLVKDSITVIILPLNQIGEEQAVLIEKIGGRLFFLNAETLKEGGKKLLRDMQEGRYADILLTIIVQSSPLVASSIASPSVRCSRAPKQFPKPWHYLPHLNGYLVQMKITDKYRSV